MMSPEQRRNLTATINDALNRNDRALLAKCNAALRASVAEDDEAERNGRFQNVIDDAAGDPSMAQVAR